MELMSSMLLCFLVALPHTLGKSDFDNKLEIKRAHRVYKNSPRAMILNMKGAYSGDNTETQSVFDDAECQKCRSCMEKAVKAKTKTDPQKPKAKELHEDLLRNQVIENRFKRDLLRVSTDDVKIEETTSKPKKVRTPKVLKPASVTKYDYNGEVYAVKVNESVNANRKSCYIFSVSKATECGSPAAAESTLNKIKKSKRAGKKNHFSTSTTLPTTKSTVRPTSTRFPKEKVPIFKKRESDSEVPDFMPSIEEMTY